MEKGLNIELYNLKFDLNMDNLDTIKDCIEKITAKNDSDLFLFCGEISDITADIFITELRNKPMKKKNCSLLLTTYGGDPDAGYRMVRTIKRYYQKFLLYVYGSCKSTGTLIALGSDQIIMSDFGEFGPLDIQLTKDDELHNTSGLSYLQSLLSLNEQIFRSFESNFLNIKQKSVQTITTKTAAEIATKLAVGLISPISAQLDPVKFGEVQRAIKIADAYGARLCTDRKMVSRLIAGYPSHGFVIDYEEAVTIFPNVRFVDQTEAILERNLLDNVRSQNDEPIIYDLTNLLQENIQENIQEHEQPANIHSNSEAPEQVEPIQSEVIQNQPTQQLLKKQLNGNAKTRKTHPKNQTREYKEKL
ncbi:MAG: hypothetical protein H9535_19925 [Ignavibacteria bacterium]|nr:hypothetical protein [Ignavibacteria bacterium]